MRRLIAVFSLIITLSFTVFPKCKSDELRCELYSIIDNAPGMVGVAFVSDADTITINNGVRYPMMSVFKLHQSIAVAHSLELAGTTMDSIIHVRNVELDKETWSPMLKTVGENDFDISIRELVDLSLKVSDNNASNLLFEKIINPIETDSYIKDVADDVNFSIIWSEAQMKRNHHLSYQNYSSPLAAALLIKDVFKKKILNEDNTDIIRKALLSVTTGKDRLGAPFQDLDDIRFAHKTGSGYTNDAGELVAFNDVAFISLPDGKEYALAVMIRDFAGAEAQAAAIMAKISALFFDYASSITEK